MALVMLLEDGSVLQHSQLSSVTWNSLGQQQQEGLAQALGARLQVLAAAGTALDGCAHLSMQQVGQQAVCSTCST